MDAKPSLPHRRRPILSLTIDPEVVARARAEASRRRISLSRYLEILADADAPLGDA